MMPLVLLAGFLGAGKTRYLTELIPLLHARGVRVRVVLNDFENATVDASRLADLDALVTPLNGECVCCTSLRDLMDTLSAIPADPGSVLLIEANGATEAQELLGHLTQDATLSHFTLPLQLTVLDAMRWQKRWWHNRLEAAQTATATHVFLNWTERASATRLATVRESVAHVAPGATYAAPGEFADTLAALTSKVKRTPRRSAPLTLVAAQRSAQPSEAQAAVPGHTHPFASATIALPEAVDRAAFLAFVRALPREVVRAKGFVRFRDRPGDMFIWNHVAGKGRVDLDHSVPHAAAQPTALFIGVKLPLQELATRIGVLNA